MSSKFTTYNLNTGRLINTGSTQGDIALQAMPGEGVLAGQADPDFWYFDLIDNTPKEKTEMVVAVEAEILADGIQRLVMSGVAVGAEMTWPDGFSEEVTNGSIEFGVDLPGVYLFRFMSIQHLRKEITVEAIAAT